jgi:hypothetical protein
MFMIILSSSLQHIPLILVASCYGSDFALLLPCFGRQYYFRGCSLPRAIAPFFVFRVDARLVPG